MIFSTLKVNLDQKETSKKDLYKINNSKLRSLPTVILGSITLLLIFVFAFYIAKVYKLDTLFSKNTEVRTSALTPEYYIKMDQKNSVSKTKPTNNLNKTESDQIQASINITQNDQACILNYSSYKPPNIVLVLEGNIQGFWTTSNCYLKNLQAIQVVKVSSDQEVILKTTLADKSVLLDNSQKIYLIEYLSRQKQTSLNYSDFTTSLISPIIKSIDASPLVTAFDSQRIINETYYLQGNCRDESTDGGCNLWKTDKNSGKPVLLKQYLAGTEVDGLNKFTKGLVLRFAAVQDSMPDAISFILDNENSKELTLIRVGTSEFNIIQQIKIDKKLNPDSYKKYFR